MADEQTCGKGLADHSPLLSKLGSLTARVAKVLEVHMNALDLDDEDARREHAVYTRLATQHRSIAAGLEATAEEMAGYWDLPMGKHDPEAMASPEAVAAFGTFVKVENELVALLRTRLERDEAMLTEMRGLGDGGDRP
jgi:hypothetical protein